MEAGWCTSSTEVRRSECLISFFITGHDVALTATLPHLPGDDVLRDPVELVQGSALDLPQQSRRHVGVLVQRLLPLRQLRQRSHRRHQRSRVLLRACGAPHQRPRVLLRKTHGVVHRGGICRRGHLAPLPIPGDDASASACLQTGPLPSSFLLTCSDASASAKTSCPLDARVLISSTAALYALSWASTLSATFGNSRPPFSVQKKSSSPTSKLRGPAEEVGSAGMVTRFMRRERASWTMAL